MWKCLKDEYYLKFDPPPFLVHIFSQNMKNMFAPPKGKVFNLLFQNFTLKLQVEFPLFKFNFFLCLRRLLNLVAGFLAKCYRHT
jgi:hypothetical protein